MPPVKKNRLARRPRRTGTSMDQGITVFRKNESDLQRQTEAAVNRKPKRGPLNTIEQAALIKVCEKRARYDEVCNITSSQFWVGIEMALEREIGRRYSHYSCRKRINDYITNRAIYQNDIKNGIKPDPVHLPDPEIRKLLDRWEEMDKYKEQLEREKALGQLVGREPEVPTKNKLQRVADWVRSLPDPEPQARPLVTPPSTNSSQSPVKQDESTALWARYRKIEDYRAIARSNQLRALNNDLTSNRQLLSNIKEQLHSTFYDPPANQTTTGLKRSREDEVSPDRAAPRPRTELAELEAMVKPPLKQSPGNSNVLTRSEIPPAQMPIETVFSKFWESMLPYFKERALKDGICLIKSESIMHDLFKEVGAAMTKAFMKLEQQTSRSPSAYKPPI
ncbi:uncharacterized protein BDW70DRAFT_148636 [Aspergillus foveolatus]|uniref:uncharacterized protein n=1 Tax=Aspergillus foveolatus TaxID=210207 RepID=UPI003CCCDF04